MAQPIPKKIKSANPSLESKPYNTLLIDGSNLLEVCFRACKQISTKGRNIGGVFEFLLQVKLMLRKGNFRHVYVFFDGPRSGQLRYNLLPEYKANRDKTFNDENLSDYMKQVNAIVKNMMSKATKNRKTVDEFEDFENQRDVLISCLEELFCRVVMCDETEADDFIGYYVANKEPNERIVIISNDRDLTQLIADDVAVYVQSMKEFITPKNHLEKMGYSHKNVLLKKIICGDVSDNIKGIKGVGEKTLFTNFPEMLTRKMTLDEVIEGARLLNENRKAEKKQPLKWAENIVNRVTDGVQGDRIYEINEKVIDLKHPLMSDDAKELMDSFMHAPMDPEGRSASNLYSIVTENGISELMDEARFASFFVEYQYLADSERKFFKSCEEK